MLAVPAPWFNRLLPAAPGQTRNCVQDDSERQCCLVEKARIGPILVCANGHLFTFLSPDIYHPLNVANFVKPFEER